MISNFSSRLEILVFRGNCFTLIPLLNWVLLYRHNKIKCKDDFNGIRTQEAETEAEEMPLSIFPRLANNLPTRRRLSCDTSYVAGTCMLVSMTYTYINIWVYIRKLVNFIFRSMVMQWLCKMVMQNDNLLPSI